MMRADLVNNWLTQQRYPVLTPAQAAALASFQQYLLEVNANMNLTAITDEAEMAVKHFIDSLTLLPWIPEDATLSVIDVGAGAGFPGLPLKIMRPDIRITWLDSLRKRILFLREAADRLSLSDVECIHARGEEISRRPPYRAAYDLCTARAVARLDTLAGCTLPFVKPGGLLLAMKGPEVTEEVKSARPALKKYGGKLVEVKKMEIADGMIHTVVVVEKMPI